MVDEEVQNKRGIYMYVLSGKTKYLNLREFDNNIKRQVYERQEGVCPVCKREGRKKFVYALEEMEADHIVPWVEGGKTILRTVNCFVVIIIDKKPTNSYFNSTLQVLFFYNFPA